MARKKVRKFASGDEIVVSGRRLATPEFSNAFDSFDIRGMTGGMPHMDGGGGGGGYRGMLETDVGGGGGGSGGGRSSSQRITPISYEAPKSDRLAVVPAFLRGETSELSDLMGEKAPRGYGFKFRSDFAKGGKAKAKPVKKMAKGGKVSSASKRGDGCATKGKTKGRFV